jgi:transcriptional regulator with XRE-family HTH domain
MLKARRVELGLTQEELCKRLKRNSKFVSQIETGAVMLEVLEFIEYSKALRMDPRDAIDQLIR